MFKHRFVQFFKDKVYPEVEEEYLEFVESIRQIKENHIILKGHEKNSSRQFKNIAEEFQKIIRKTNPFKDKFGHLEDSFKQEALENFVEA